MRRTHSVVLAGLLVSGLLTWPVESRRADLQSASGVPANLRPLLTPKQSEMRLVVQRYRLDRQLLSGNYAGAIQGRGGRGGGRGAAASTASVDDVPVSPARLARLKRFDLNWQQAIAAIDQTGLSDDAMADLRALRASIADNLRELESDAATLTALRRFLPFAQPLVDQIEARIRIEEMDALRAAGVLDVATKELARTRAQLP
jgi:hypothetical protein